MEITKFHIGPKLVKYEYRNASSQGVEFPGNKCPEAPTPECQAALKDLVDVILPIMELPEHWKGKEDAPLLAVNGFDLRHTKAGTRSIQISFKKAFRCGKTETYKTPMVQIDDPVTDEGETEKSALDNSLRVLCNNAIEQATLYIGGTRSQMTLEGVQIGRVDPEADPNQEDMDPNQEDMDLSTEDPADE